MELYTAVIEPTVKHTDWRIIKATYDLLISSHYMNQLTWLIKTLDARCKIVNHTRGKNAKANCKNIEST
ncbi:uncharacterized protein Smp_204220 [Schistosoma mansoni]|uniref:uncharacterized protein n=1 Tax=Schistosoma mansoni TaxID=6183 RepID=UPI00022DCC8D|nr:uncharacterized protein Smp_204220 [Schistosoma mansoni]|eukprot:XP_018655200.1 uncharacterized protein Smp_204220 [Schistosoma mansoni]